MGLEEGCKATFNSYIDTRKLVKKILFSSPNPTTNSKILNSEFLPKKSTNQIVFNEEEKKEKKKQELSNLF